MVPPLCVGLHQRSTTVGLLHVLLVVVFIPTEASLGDLDRFTDMLQKQVSCSRQH